MPIIRNKIEHYKDNELEEELRLVKLSFEYSKERASILEKYIEELTTEIENRKKAKI